MLAGHELYAVLASVYPLYDGGLKKGRVAIETFPQAVACALAGSIVSAKKKGLIRRELLSRTGLQSADFRNIDEVDAALCALSAEGFLRGEFMRFGDPAGGFIIVPGRESIRRGWSNQTR
jgi:predicted nuclease with RNAse H fold